MYYKLYIDSVFLMQFSMNLYLIALTGKVLKCTATHGKICAGALAGAALSCFMLALPAFSLYVRIALSALPVSMCMVHIAFGIRKRLLLRSSLIVAGCGFFIGSIMIWILNRLIVFMKEGAGVAAIAAVGYLSYRILCFLIDWIRKKKDNNILVVQIPIPGLEKNVKVKALVDTGNHLSEPISGKPVCLISEKMARVIEKAFLREKYRAVPYTSVGKKRGVLAAYELPYIILEETYRETKVEHVFFAICNAGISEESPYQIVLHPRLLEN